LLVDVRCQIVRVSVHHEHHHRENFALMTSLPNSVHFELILHLTAVGNANFMLLMFYMMPETLNTLLTS